MSQTSKLDRVVSVVLTVAVVVAVGFLVEGRLNPPKTGGASHRIERIKNWSTLAAGVGIPLDRDSARVQVDVFTDFQCPYCFALDSVLTKLESDLPGKISRTVYEFPIPSHPHARLSAKAFECAAAQSRAREMHHLLYTNQSKFAEDPWNSFAQNAGVANFAEFQKCMANDSSAFKMGKGLELGHKLGVTATPTVIVNGWLFDPSFPDDIVHAVRAVLAGKLPNQR